tara:strand:- start:877 stop:1770 length:894 start_codon:yes stop_codon:yes gene_type:complete
MLKWWNSFYAKSDNAKAYVLLSPALILVVIGMAVPLIAVFSVSFTTQASFVIDYTPTFDRYIEFMDTSTRTGNVLTTLLGRSLSISFLVAFFTLITTYPVAYYVAFYVKKNKMLWLVLMTLPFWTSYLLRVFAWKLILGHGGVINASLMTVGFIDEPLSFLMYSQTAVVITLAHAWAAFALLPLYVSLEKIDYSLIEASYDLGCTKFETFWRVVWPLSLPGVIGAVLIIFIPTVGDYVTPALVGGTEGRMLSNMIQTYFGRANNFPLGAASAVIMLISVALITFAVNIVTKRLTQRL